MAAEEPTVIENKTLSIDDLIPETTYRHCTLDYSNQDINVQQVTLDNCTFVQHDFTKSAWLDCTFIGLDWSNCQFGGGYFTGCTFKDTKLVGADLYNCGIIDLTLTDCLANYVNFSESIIKGLHASASRLQESYWTAVKFTRKIQFAHCDLTRADFGETKLKNLDFTTSELAGLRFDWHLAQGMKISPDQAPNLVGMMGITVVY